MKLYMKKWGIQLTVYLRRVYLKCMGNRTTLLHEGFKIRNSTNPYSTGAKNPKDKVLKLQFLACHFLLMTAQFYIMLHVFEVDIKRELKHENIRHPITYKMTSV